MIRRGFAFAADAVMCGAINLLQVRHRLDRNARAEMERYVEQCALLTVHQYYALPNNSPLPELAAGTAMTWTSPVPTAYAANNVARVDLFPGPNGWTAPTVLMLHALMSAGDVGYRRWASRFNRTGWNACFVHLPYHYSRVPPAHWNGELAITADLIRNAEGLRQGVIELRQLLAALRRRGGSKFAILGTSYGAWIGALLACVEPELEFAALMAPIVNVEHAIWESPAAFVLRRELKRAGIEPDLVARHFHLSSPGFNQPACGAEKVLFVAGDWDLIARPEDVEEIHRRWRGSELLRVRQGHFGYRMMRETVERLKARRL